MNLKQSLITGLLCFGITAGASATSLVATTDALVGAVASTTEAVSDISSSLRDSKVVRAARDDAASFVASNGVIRGARLETALIHIRQQAPELAKTEDMQLAQAILSR
ncbi:DUF2388 domain-containing protein [Pseudomonas sp. NCCP-436]|uniref:DUF2388 domain-containing protein n=1 Tax=Pseudomonas sp. NCCP-436 TaxID=2842481 RepID=UPI001C7E3F19|nr:DUF2388 domain-containing protein [Pseudomonas sp. NCCP-436]GIZ10593.1 hypothetical protein NCCP436_00090 [Pseudomonas sp. NCCP-436]